MWGQSFTYEKSNNCMVMWFDGKNPNEKVKLNTTGENPAGAAVTSYQSKFINMALALSLIKLLC